MSKIIAVPGSNTLTSEKELVLIPRREYEALLRLRVRRPPKAELTDSEKRAIAASEKELQKGKYFTLAELSHEMGSSRSGARH